MTPDSYLDSHGNRVIVSGAPVTADEPKPYRVAVISTQRSGKGEEIARRIANIVMQSGCTAEITSMSCPDPVSGVQAMTAKSPVKVIDGDDGSERDCPDLDDDQMWPRPGNSRGPDGYPRLIDVPAEPGWTELLLPEGLGNTRYLLSAKTADRMRDELIALRGSPDPRMDELDQMLAELIEVRNRFVACIQTRDKPLVWTEEPPECDCWWGLFDSPVPASSLTFRNNYWSDGQDSFSRQELTENPNYRFAAIPGGIPRGPA